MFELATSPPRRVMSHGTQSPSVGDAVIAGAISGMFSASMTYPFGTNDSFSLVSLISFFWLLLTLELADNRSIL